MEEQELKHIWKRSSEKEEIKLDIEQLIKEFKKGMESRERIVRKRDLREIIGAILGAFAFIIIAAEFPFSIGTIGIIIIIVSLFYSVYKLRINRKRKHSQELFLSMNEQLMNQKQFMSNQARLLNTVLYWMMLPFFTGYMIFIWSIWNVEQYNLSPFLSFVYPENLKSKIVFTLVTAIYCSYIVWMNKKAVKVNWEPLIKQIDTILNNLKKEEN